MKTLLALDPGLNYPAWAVFMDGVLSHAQRTKVPISVKRLSIGARCRKVAELVAEDVGPYITLVDELIIEWPKVYTAAKSKGDPNDLLPLVGVGMYFSAYYPSAELFTPTPREWLGGQIPKATTGDPWVSPRGSRIYSRLSEAERARIVVSHDSLDAVGLGLYRLGRFQARRVLPGVNDV